MIETFWKKELKPNKLTEWEKTREAYKLLTEKGNKFIVREGGDKYISTYDRLKNDRWRKILETNTNWKKFNY